jgi:transcription elongation factor GreB
MSKAFVKDDAEIEESLDFDYDPIGEDINYITPAGYEGLKQTLANLIPGPDRDRRARLLRRHLDTAQVVAPELQRGGRVLFGATVTVRDEEGAARVYRIVGVDETDFAKGKISWISPIAKALLQGKAGDVVQLKTPNGEEDLEIEKVEFKPIA